MKQPKERVLSQLYVTICKRLLTHLDLFQIHTIRKISMYLKLLETYTSNYFWRIYTPLTDPPSWGQLIVIFLRGSWSTDQLNLLCLQTQHVEFHFLASVKEQLDCPHEITTSPYMDQIFAERAAWRRVHTTSEPDYKPDPSPAPSTR